jgi:predicted RNA binding protein YcfA (HicA-like mRNA interferase family)
MVRFLEQQGFTVIRIRGSHHFLARDEPSEFEQVWTSD